MAAMALAKVKRLFVTRVKGGVPNSVDSVEVTAEGVKGDYHAGITSDRHILIQSESVMTELDLDPGDLFENMLVEELDVMSLHGGVRIQVGNAVIEVTIECEPCARMESVRLGLRKASLGKRGKFARVVQPGRFSVGDTIALI